MEKTEIKIGNKVRLNRETLERRINNAGDYHQDRTYTVEKLEEKTQDIRVWLMTGGHGSFVNTLATLDNGMRINVVSLILEKEANDE